MWNAFGITGDEGGQGFKGGDFLQSALWDCKKYYPCLDRPDIRRQYTQAWYEGMVMVLYHHALDYAFEGGFKRGLCPLCTVTQR